MTDSLPVKRILYSLLPALMFASCHTDGTTKAPAVTGKTDNMQHMEPAMIVNPGDITDPICGMVKDSTWTDYSIYKGDTVWFCAAGEKMAFDARPEKYASRLHPHPSSQTTDQ